ncbi:MAG: hypothetical protein ACLQG5_00820 [Methanobacterium sp.]
MAQHRRIDLSSGKLKNLTNMDHLNSFMPCILILLSTGLISVEMNCL